MSDRTIRALAMAGSLRAASFNRALLRTIVERAPEGMEIEELDLSTLPLYHGDLEAQGDPAPVAELKRAVHAADLVFLVTPEYNGGLPPVMKNAIDWGSRPPRPQAWEGTPIAILGATPGRGGTAGAQRVLRETLSQLSAYVMPQPRMLVADAGALFDEDLRLTDEATLARLDKFMVAAAEWARVFEKA